MNVLRIGYWIVSISGTSALLLACGALPPSVSPGNAMPKVTQALDSVNGSWLSPEASAQDLLYVSDGTWVSVYSYPSGKFEGRLGNFNIAQGMCVDKAGDVYVTDSGYNRIFEYAHGGTKRIVTLNGWGRPAGCSVDPISGDLAATASDVGTGSGSGLAVYKKARGRPTIYQDTSIWRSLWCGYDNAGNVFVDGEGYGSGDTEFVLAELPKQGTVLKQIALIQSMGFPGGIQWDGKYLSVGSYYPPPTGRPVIYQFAISGGKGTKAGTTRLGGLGSVDDVKQFWIQGSTVVIPNGGAGDGKHGAAVFYKYPAGGNPTKRITHGLVSTQSTAISLAK